MSDGVALVILLASTQISQPTAVALERAARDVLGSNASISVIEQATPLGDEAALARAGAADGVVEVSWNVERRTAELHCYVASERRWLDRTITFDSGDADSERGRLLGFVIGSMLLAEGQGEFRAMTNPARRRPAVPSDTFGAQPSAPARPQPSRWLELAGTFTTSVEGSADALGVSAGLRARIAPSLRLVTGLDASFGEIEEAQATRVFASGRFGIAWQPYRTHALGDLGFGVRSELFLGWLGVTHLSEDDPAPDRQSRLLGGGRALAEVSLGLSESAGTFLGFGPVLVAGKTDIYTHGSLASTIPVLWLTAEIGVHAAF